MADKDLSHDEIWDDSILITSWDEAVEEYQKYHSIAARHVDVEEAIRLYEATELKYGGPAAEESTGNEAISALSRDDVVDGDARSRRYHTTVPEEVLEDVPETIQVPPPHPILQPHPPSLPLPMPEMLASNTTNEGIKNLMMSWYYAGYYTGRLEGQQEVTKKAQF